MNVCRMQESMGGRARARARAHTHTHTHTYRYVLYGQLQEGETCAAALRRLKQDATAVTDNKVLFDKVGCCLLSLSPSISDPLSLSLSLSSCVLSSIPRTPILYLCEMCLCALVLCLSHVHPCANTSHTSGDDSSRQAAGSRLPRRLFRSQGGYVCQNESNRPCPD